MRITHTVPSLALSDGGPPRSVSQLCGQLVQLPLPVSIVTEERDEELVPVDTNLEVLNYDAGGGSFLGRLKPTGFRTTISESHASHAISLIHQHGVWLRSSHAAIAFATQHSVPIVLAPRGMLEPWAMNHSKWKKKLAWALYQQRDLSRVTAFHATAHSEAESIRRLGFKQPIAVIPNGVQLPEVAGGRWDMVDGESDLRSSNSDLPRQRTAFFLSRINPKKGLPMLLDAWKKLSPEGWRLVIAGNDDSQHLPEVKAKIAALGLREQVKLVGPLFGAAKELAYREADLFVLPSYSENFGIVVAEALGYGLPVLTTTGCPWQELIEGDCGWWVDPTPAGIENGLQVALSRSSEQLDAMGQRGRALVERNYQWPGIAQRMHSFYDWILNGGKQPDFVV